MARRGFETSGTFVKMVVDTDVTKLPASEAGFVVAGVVTSKGYIMVTASPPNFSASEGDFFFPS